MTPEMLASHLAAAMHYETDPHDVNGLIDHVTGIAARNETTITLWIGRQTFHITVTET